MKTKIAVDTAREFIANNPNSLDEVRFVVFDKVGYKTYCDYYSRI